MSAPVAGGQLTRHNLPASMIRRALFQGHSWWCKARRKLRHYTQRPHSLGHDMITTPAMTSRTIWMYWDNGWDAMPHLARLAYDSWRRKNPGWTVRLLDKEQAIALTDIPPEILSKQMLPAHLADLIRLELLARHGGVWADASSLCEVPLDEWLHAAMPFGFFAFAIAEQKTVGNWFLAAAQGNPIVTAWRDMAYSFWSCADRPTTYLMFYDLFALAMIKDRRVGRMWRYSSRLDRTQANILRYEYLNRDLTEEFAAFVERAMIPLHKFSFREVIPDDFSGTPLALVLGCERRDQLQARAAEITP